MSLGFDQPAQMPLALDFGGLDSFDNFAVGDNQSLLLVLQEQIESAVTRFCYLWSEGSNGKTHLLQASCCMASQRGMRAMYIPLRELFERESPAVLDGLASVDLLALDDIDAIAGDADWEQALYVLLYAARDSGTLVTISGNTAVESLDLITPDLRTRLAWDGTWRVENLNDLQLADFLLSETRRRGLNMSEDAARYVVNHHSRDMSALSELIDRLDIASLAERRSLTTAFVKPFVVERL